MLGRYKIIPIIYKVLFITLCSEHLSYVYLHITIQVGVLWSYAHLASENGPLGSHYLVG